MLGHWFCLLFSFVLLGVFGHWRFLGGCFLFVFVLFVFVFWCGVLVVFGCFVWVLYFVSLFLLGLGFGFCRFVGCTGCAYGVSFWFFGSWFVVWGFPFGFLLVLGLLLAVLAVWFDGSVVGAFVFGVCLWVLVCLFVGWICGSVCLCCLWCLGVWGFVGLVFSLGLVAVCLALCFLLLVCLLFLVFLFCLRYGLCLVVVL